MLATLTLLLALAAPQEPGTGTPKPLTAEVTAARLEEEIDRSLHWLRLKFDLATKSYGGLEADALALTAFATSPRKYRVSEGPFLSAPLAGLLAAQKPDGTFGTPDQDLLVLVALEAVAEPSASAAAERLVATRPDLRLACEGPTQPAEPLLARRNADGSYGSGALATLETARSVRYLSRLHAELKALEPKKAPKEARPLPVFEAAQRDKAARALQRGAQFLLMQRIDGGWGFDGRRDAGITAMAVAALAAVPEPRPAEVQAALLAGLDWLCTLQKDDGSIHEGQIANYVTSAAVLALSRSGREADRARILRAIEFLRVLQADEPEGYSEGDRYYGGVGYGNDERPDLSNLQMALEAMHAGGVPSSDPAFQKALKFLQRCQNHSETNELAIVSEGKTYVSGNDGGASYAPGESKAGYVDLPDGKRIPRSYGSMSYALLKGYLFAGLTKDDPRVQALWKWLRENYTLDVNPGFPASDDPTASYQGLFYYFYTMAKALDLYGEETIVDGAGHSHAWRGELAGRIAAMQRQDGSWLNENSSKWFEANPVLATSYALLTLGTALPK